MVGYDRRALEHGKHADLILEHSQSGNEHADKKADNHIYHYDQKFLA